MAVTRILINEIGPFDKIELTFNPKVTILTGPNGSGKSTILYSIASTFSQSSTEMFQRAHVEAKNSPRSEIQLDNGDFRTCVVERGSPNHMSSIFDASTNLQLVLNNQFSKVYALSKAGRRTDYISRVGQLRSDTMRAMEPFDWALFAYSGQRSMQSRLDLKIGESPFTPLADAATFNDNNSSSKNFVQWIANTLTKRAIYQVQGDKNKLRSVDQSIEALERALSIVTEKEISFELKTEPFSVALKMDGRSVEYFVLPSGLQSIVAWMGDLLMRLEYIPWENETPILARKFTLLLDEIEVHLHPNWQKKILPVVIDLFPNAQIIVSTHSPFVVGSVDGATIYDFATNGNGIPYIENVTISDAGMSYQRILREVFNLSGTFGSEVDRDLEKFRKSLSDLRKNSKQSEISPVLKIATKLAEKNEEIKHIVLLELKQAERNLGIDLKI